MKNIFVLILLVMMSCQEGGTFDLSEIENKTEVNSTLNKLNISGIQTQNGYWELRKKRDKVEAELHNNGIISTIYSLKEERDEKLFNFDNFKIEKSSGGKIVENDNKIVFVNVALDHVETFNVLNKLKDKLGNPDQIVYDRVINSATDEKVKVILKKFEKDYINIKKDEFDDEYLTYPVYFVWNINGYIYKFTVIINETSFSNDLVIISNKAFNEKLIFGYHNPKEDLLFKKYYN
ncbi:hypothetical protein ACFSX9_05745 [Flavobacterium ardleyense]|uniref:Lipoprotein n=1 Tax=Flavobacterium ardleyense TaxID=2038737 RepID=A0ABW5Z696_9FLAO